MPSRTAILATFQHDYSHTCSILNETHVIFRSLTIAQLGAGTIHTDYKLNGNPNENFKEVKASVKAKATGSAL